jgi:hypothetical protein
MELLNIYTNYFVIKFARKQEELSLQACIAFIVNKLIQPVLAANLAELMGARKLKGVNVI